MDIYPSPDETIDSFLNGELKVIQKKKGYRFSIDAILLSQFIKIRKNEKAIDLGTGCAIIPLLLAKMKEDCLFTGIEIQDGLFECAKKNVKLNNLEHRISILHQDLRRLKTIFPPGSFDVVFSNPPYRRSHTGRLNPSIEKAIARHEILGTIEDLVSVASYLLPNKGRFYLIFNASRAADLISTLKKENLEPKNVRFVHSNINEEAKFILLESIKSSGVELKVMGPLILNNKESSEKVLK